MSQSQANWTLPSAIPWSQNARDGPATTRATLKSQVTDLCMRCHGVMGKRQNQIDHGPDAHFDEKWVFAADPANGITWAQCC